MPQSTPTLHAVAPQRTTQSTPGGQVTPEKQDATFGQSRTQSVPMQTNGAGQVAAVQPGPASAGMPESVGVDPPSMGGGVAASRAARASRVPPSAAAPLSRAPASRPPPSGSYPTRPQPNARASAGANANTITVPNLHPCCRECIAAQGCTVRKGRHATR